MPRSISPISLILFTLVILSLVFGVLGTEDDNQLKLYPEFDSINIVEYLSNERRLKLQFKCLVDDGPCDAVGHWLKPVRRLSRASSDGPPISSGRSYQSRPVISNVPPGSILTYDGRVVSRNSGSVGFVPGREAKTPSIENQPQYGSFRGDLPPDIPDFVPRDLPQFRPQGSSSRRSLNSPPHFETS